MLNAEVALVEARVELLLADRLFLIRVVIIAIYTEEVDAVDLEAPLRTCQHG